MEEKEQEKQLEICPCCGKPTLEPDKVQLSNQIVDHYLTCVLTGEPFAKDYYLFNNKLRIRITSLSDETLDTMNLLTSKFNFLQQDSLRDAYRLFVERLFTFLPIVSISIKVNGEQKVKDIQAIVKPLLKEAIEHVKDQEWLSKSYSLLLDPQTVFQVPKNVLDKVSASHLKLQKFLETQSSAKNFFQGIVRD